jgi:predicted DNA-binding transcriptional regulator AlpA
MVNRRPDIEAETTRSPSWAVDGADLDSPSIARMYDYLLGGSRHAEADREIAHDAVRAAPRIKLTIWENRKALKRMVRYLVGEGITQILDIGSGIPARGAVHSVAQAMNPEVKVVYVDIDPVAAARGADVLANDPNGASVQGDLTQPERILALPEVTSMLDLSRPVALLFLNVLHFVDPVKVTAALAVFRDALAPGSYLAITHGTGDQSADGDDISKVYAGAYGFAHWRTKEELVDLFGDFQLVEPGVVELAHWRPEPSPLSGAFISGGALNCYAAVGVKAE